MSPMSTTRGESRWRTPGRTWRLAALVLLVAVGLGLALMQYAVRGGFAPAVPEPPSAARQVMLGDAGRRVAARIPRSSLS